jgi:hypothetical protein
MKDVHANLFVGLTAPKRFPGVRPTRGEPIHPHLNFSPAWSPVLRGMGIFFEKFRSCYRLASGPNATEWLRKIAILWWFGVINDGSHLG